MLLVCHVILQIHVIIWPCELSASICHTQKFSKSGIMIYNSKVPDMAAWRTQLEVCDDLGICVLNLQIALRKIIAYEFYHSITFVRPIFQNQNTNLHQFQKDCHRDNMSFPYIQFYKHNCLNILVGNICFYKQVINH